MTMANITDLEVLDECLHNLLRTYCYTIICSVCVCKLFLFSSWEFIKFLTITNTLTSKQNIALT